MINLINGDCLEEMQNIPDGSVDAIITDPPYGTTACSWDSVIDFDLMWEQLNRIIKSNGAIVLFGSQPFTSKLICSNLDMFKYCWIWEKQQGTGFLNAKKQPLKNAEDIIVFYKKQCLYNPQMRKGFDYYRCRSGQTKSENYGKQTDVVTVSNGDRYPLSVIKEQTEQSVKHPTQKPINLMSYLIKTYTNENETVLDFTMGSGTTGVACKNLNRKFIGIELDKGYFDIATDRINNANRMFYNK